MLWLYSPGRFTLRKKIDSQNGSLRGPNCILVPFCRAEFYEPKASHFGYLFFSVQTHTDRSNAKNVFWHHCYLALRSMSKVGVMVPGQGPSQISSAQQSILGARHCQVQQRAVRVITSLVCLCVCIRGHQRMITHCVNRGCGRLACNVCIALAVPHWEKIDSQNGFLRGPDCILVPFCMQGVFYEPKASHFGHLFFLVQTHTDREDRF